MAAVLNGTEIQPRVTTLGRRSGQPHTVQIRVYYWDGRMIATSPYPRIRRDWVQNVIANEQVTIEVGGRSVRARARVLADEPRTTENVAMRRISWRSQRCPVFQPSSDTFVEFLPECAPEELYDPAHMTHDPATDPLAATNIEEVLRWQSLGSFYGRRAD